jgi:hypothetical protein
LPPVPPEPVVVPPPVDVSPHGDNDGSRHDSVAGFPSLLHVMLADMRQVKKA